MYRAEDRKLVRSRDSIAGCNSRHFRARPQTTPLSSFINQSLALSIRDSSLFYAKDQPFGHDPRAWNKLTFSRVFEPISINRDKFDEYSLAKMRLSTTSTGVYL